MIPSANERPNAGGLAGLDDERLVQRALERPGSEPARQAASALLRRYQDRVYIWCYRYVRNHDAALDLAQEVLLQAYRKLDSFRREARFSSWLFAIARNKCLSAVRTPRLLVDDDRDLERLSASEKDAEQQLEEQQDEQALLERIRQVLEPQEQEALWLRCIEKVPVDEITRLLEIESATGARALLQKARRKLRAALNQPEGRRRRERG